MDKENKQYRAAIDLYSADELVQRIAKATFSKPEQAERAFDCMKKHVDEGFYQQYIEPLEQGNLRVILVSQI